MLTRFFSRRCERKGGLGLRYRGLRRGVEVRARLEQRLGLGFTRDADALLLEVLRTEEGLGLGLPPGG